MTANNEFELISDELCGLTHRVQIPKGAGPRNPVPVVVMLHGYGGDETVMWVFRRVVPEGVAIVSPRAIIKAPEMEEGYCWFKHQPNKIRTSARPESLQTAVDTLYAFLKALPEHYPVTLKQLVVIGFSQGAAMCNSIAITYPDMLQGMASIAGAIPESIMEVMHYPDLLTDLPVFIAHGVRDERIPLQQGHYTRETFLQLGAEVTYHEYSTGHKISLDGIRDLREWLKTILPHNE